MGLNKIQSEQKKYERLYTDISFACNDLKTILDDSELKKRVFIRKADELTKYIESLKELESKLKYEQSAKKGLFSKFLKSSNDVDADVNSLLTRDARQSISKLELCKNCKCINCVNTCPFNQCMNCRELEFSKECDKEQFVFTLSSDRVTLYSGDEAFNFSVKGYLLEIKDERIKRYIYLVDEKDVDNQQLLEYYRANGEDIYESVIEEDATNLDRLFSKFIEMGLNV